MKLKKEFKRLCLDRRQFKKIENLYKIKELCQRYPPNQLGGEDTFKYIIQKLPHEKNIVKIMYLLKYCTTFTDVSNVIDNFKMKQLFNFIVKDIDGKEEYIRFIFDNFSVKKIMDRKQVHQLIEIFLCHCCCHCKKIIYLFEKFPPDTEYGIKTSDIKQLVERCLFYSWRGYSRVKFDIFKYFLEKFPPGTQCGMDPTINNFIVFIQECDWYPDDENDNDLKNMEYLFETFPPGTKYGMDKKTCIRAIDKMIDNPPDYYEDFILPYGGYAYDPNQEYEDFTKVEEVYNKKLLYLFRCVMESGIELEKIDNYREDRTNEVLKKHGHEIQQKRRENVKSVLIRIRVLPDDIIDYIVDFCY